MALRAAQAIVNSSPAATVVIDVAQGTYSPGVSSGATFQLIDDVSLYGGFPGYASGATNLNSANVAAYPTVLSTTSTTTDAVTATGTNGSAVLNGFTIADANAPGDTYGITFGGANPTITGCTFTAETIWVVDTNQTYVQGFNGSGGYDSSFGSYGSGDGEFSWFYGIAVAPNGNIYFADAGNNRVEEFSKAGVFIESFGSYGSGDGQLDSPNALAVDAAGDVWVADTNNNRVEEFSASGTYMSSFGSEGS
jgi:hypothetical protein